MWCRKNSGITVAWTTAIVCVSATFGPSVVDITTVKSLPAQPVIYTRTPILNAYGCDRMTANEWFLLAIDIQNKGAQLDAEERMFIRNVINRLAVEVEVMPTPAHKEWLCNLKRRLKL